MQAMESIFTGEQGVAYIPMPKGRGFTPRLVNTDVSNQSAVWIFQVGS